MKKTEISDRWDESSCGGCANHGAYNMNPTFVCNILDDCEAILRIRVVSEMHNGEWISDPDKFKYTVNAGMFGYYLQKFPPHPGSLNLRGLKSPVLSTYGGKYYNN